jgi:hypothetical protein
MEKAAKAENRIKNICDSLGITNGGRQWLDVAIDPFKDIPQKPIGFPDRVMTNSTVQTVHTSYDISGSSLGFASNWDLNLFIDPLFVSKDLYSNSASIPNIYFLSTQGVTPYKRGGIVARAALSGTPLDITTTQNTACQDLVIDVFDNETSARIMGIGLEVHNTTASLNKQGSVICYRVSDEPMEYPIVLGNVSGTANSSGVYSAMELVEPPFTASEAIDLPGSVQWDAEKGVYVVPQMICEDNKPQDLKHRAIVSIDANTGITYTTGIILGAGSQTGLSPTNTNASHAFGLAGSYFTGLSPETTLTINLTYYIEQFPSFQSPLRRLATPSCPEDPAALELYTKVIRHMPTGVEVNDNFLGAFISGASRVMQMVARYAPKVANAANTAVRVANGVSEFARIAGGTQSVTGSNSLSLGRAISISNDRPHPKSDNEIDMVENKSVVVNTSNGAKEIKTHVEKSIVPYNQNRAPRTRRNRSRATVVKNQRDKDYNRLDKYIRAGNAGNKYIM